MTASPAADGDGSTAVGQVGGLLAGAARIEVTPGGDDLPAPFTGVADPIFARAVVLDDQERRIALVAVDIIGMSSDLWREVAGRVEAATGIAADDVLLFASHSHSVPAELGETFIDAIVASVVQAVAERRPAALIVGEGSCHINVNRNLFDTGTHQWREGRNDRGPSDKTVTTLHLVDESAQTIAVVHHYAVHAVVTGLLDRISGDIPGVASRHVESALGERAVALFASGCAGDQNPIHYQQTFDLRARRIEDHRRRGVDISNEMPRGGSGLDREDLTVQRLLQEQTVVCTALGVVLAEEVLDTVRNPVTTPRRQVRLRSDHVVVRVPGRRRTDSGRAGRPGSYEPAEDVSLRVGMLALGEVLVGCVDAELFTEIGQRFRRVSPARHSMIVTLCNGRSESGYVASNSAGGYHTFEVLSSRLQPGFAEGAIVDALVGLADVDTTS